MIRNGCKAVDENLEKSVVISHKKMLEICNLKESFLVNYYFLI